MRNKISKEFLKCMLTNDEKLDLSSSLAEAYTGIQELEEQKKSAMSALKAQIDSKTADATRMARLVHDGYEMRHVECETIYDLSLKLATVLRKDTGEVLKERPMTQDELQEELKFFAEKVVDHLASDPSGPTEYNGVGQKALISPDIVEGEFTEDEE